MSDEAWPNLAAMFFERAAAGGEQPFLWSKHGGAFRPQSWRRVAEEASALSRGLRAAGVGAGDRVALVSENRPNWVVADLAIMAAGAVPVPAYVTNTTDNHHHILTDSGAAAAIVSTPALAERLLPAAARAPDLRFVVAMEPPEGGGGGVDVRSWADVIKEGRARTDDVAEVVGRVGRRDLACLIYTSGTGGEPKGVMLSHGAILSNLRGARDMLSEFGLTDEVFLSILPLSHSYEHTAGLHLPISIGAQIYYGEGAESLAANMVEVHPTFMVCVPRLYEVMSQRILGAAKRASRLRRKLFFAALDLGRRKYSAPDSLTWSQRIVDRVVERLVRDKVRERFGGRLKALVSGGAPLNPDVGLFFVALGLPALQGYGQTEAAPVITANSKTGNRLDTVGAPLPGVEVRIADDGEVLVRGELLMDGYWNDPEATRAAIQDGWLHTGDIGVLDDDGHLRITDRKKDIIVNSGGDNVSPQRVEGILCLRPEIAQALVYGDRRPHLVALLVPDAELIETADDDEGLRRAVAEAVARANDDLSAIEQVKRFALASEPFSIDNGELTPTLKIRRHAILARYRETLEELY